MEAIHLLNGVRLKGLPPLKGCRLKGLPPLKGRRLKEIRRPKEIRLGIPPLRVKMMRTIPRRAQ